MDHSVSSEDPVCMDSGCESISQQTDTGCESIAQQTDAGSESSTQQTDTGCESITQLFNQLINNQLKDVERVFFKQPTYSREVVCRRLRKTMFNTLFENSSGRFKKHKHVKVNLLSAELELSSRVYGLRCKRQFDEANQLEGFSRKLKEGDLDGSALDSLLRFLVCLTDSCQKTDSAPIGHGEGRVPVVYSDKDVSEFHPDGPVYYGDTCQYNTRFTNMYMQYPRHIFHGKEMTIEDECAMNQDFVNPQIFTSTPGKNLHGEGLFNVKGYLRDKHEKRTRQTLFGALVQRSHGNVNMKLELPDLPEVIDSRSLSQFKIPKISLDSSKDEGFSSEGSTPLDDSALSHTIEEPDNLWELALKHVPNRHYTWENIGRSPGPTERPYLTEAGPLAVDAVQERRTHLLSILDPSVVLVQPLLVSMTILVKDVFNLLLALPSETFLFCEKTRKFTLKPGTHISGLTSEGLANLCEEFMECGANHWRLTQFASPPIVNSMYSSGLIFQAFTSGVRKYLQHFRASVLSVSQNKTVMEVAFMFRNVMSQMRYLADLCMCNSSHNGGGDTGTTSDLFPNGLKLLSYLYKETQVSCNSSNYPMMLSLLKTACAPYLMFIQDWVFYGVCRDVYSEFMIQVNTDYLQFRDKHYWTMGYVLTSQNATESVPMFLSHLANDIFVCGKSINLLRLCCPDHFMCTLDHEIPRVTITFSEHELKSVSDNSAAYTSRMQQIAKHKILSRAERLHLEERAKQDLLVKARQVASAELDRLQARITEMKLAEDVKKRKLFDELKHQMKKDLGRRAIEVEDEKEADIARIEDAKQRQLLEAEADEELERQAREELVEYYAQLSEEAAAREQRALWRVSRRKRDAARVALLTQDEAKWRSEMEAATKKETTETTRLLDISMAPPPVVTLGDNVPNLLDDTVPVLPEVDSPVTPDQFLRDMIAKTTTASDTLAEDEGPSELDQALSAISSVPTDNLLELSTLAIPQASGNTGMGSSQGTVPRNVLDVSIADLPSWTQQPYKNVEGDDGTIGSLRATQGGGPGGDGAGHPPEIPKLSEDATVPSWVTKGLKKPLTPPSGLDAVPLDGVPNWARLGLQDADGGTVNVIDENVELNAVDSKTTATKHPSQSSIGDLLYPAVETSSERNVSDKAPVETPSVGIAIPAESRGEQHVTSEIKDLLYPVALSSGDRNVSDKAPGETPNVGIDVPAESSGEKNVTSESKIVSEISHVKTVGGQQASSESQEVSEKLHRKSVVGSHFSHESEEINARSHVKTVEGIHASVESAPAVEVVKKASIHGHVTEETEQAVTTVTSNIHGHASVESAPTMNVVKKASVHGHVSEQTAETVKHIKSNIHGHASQETLPKQVGKKKANFFGHVSQMSRGDSEILVPRIKCFEDRHASKESEVDRSYEVVRRRPRNVPKALQVTEESDFKPGVKVTGEMFASKESEFVDVDAKRLEKFKVQNVRGHSSDSSVQRLLYGVVVPVNDMTIAEEGDIQDNETSEVEDLGFVDMKPLPYEVNFDRIFQPPATDLTEGIVFDPSSGLQAYGITDDPDVDAHEYLTLDTLMTRSLTTPIMSQVSLVNKCVVNYFLSELKIEDHFIALRRFLFMQDGEFSQMLSDQLFEKLATNPHPQTMLNPAFLNRALTRAIQSGIGRKNSASNRLSFALKFMPDVFLPNAVNSLDCLELNYKVDWPLNIVITESCYNKYCKVFSFMLQLRRTTWVLKDVVFRLKRSALLHNAGNSTQFRQMQLYRHEMQHFVNIIQGYIANQIIHVTWQEFQDQMTNDVHSLDDLHHKHADYLNRAIFRCLLNKKAAPVMKVITDIFCLILKFRSQLLSATWQRDPTLGETVHPAFEQMLATCKTFKEYSAFLFKVINILAARGYQPHLQELLLRLNFNNFYQST